MLSYQLSSTRIGLRIEGHADDFTALRDVLTAVAGQVPSCIVRPDSALLALANVLRRGADRIHYPDPTSGGDSLPGSTLAQCRISWPLLMFQVRLLRTALAFMASTKWQQAHAYLLEALVEAAIRDDFGPASEEVLQRYRRIDPTHPWAEDQLESRSAHFCRWTSSRRQKQMGNLLWSLDPTYTMSYQQARRVEPNPPLLAPAELEVFEPIDEAALRW